MNGDCDLTVTDVIMLINYAVNGGAEGVSPEVADINGDGEVNITDITQLISMVLDSED